MAKNLRVDGPVHAKIFEPTPEQVLSANIASCQRAMARHEAKKLAKPPVIPEGVEGFDVPAVNKHGHRLDGLEWTGYQVGGRLFLESKPISKGAMSTWYDCGHIPEF
jgi:hypothetical protein